MQNDVVPLVETVTSQYRLQHVEWSVRTEIRGNRQLWHEGIVDGVGFPCLVAIVPLIERVSRQILLFIGWVSTRHLSSIMRALIPVVGLRLLDLEPDLNRGLPQVL